jgi:hypothetical protein
MGIQARGASTYGTGKRLKPGDVEFASIVGIVKLSLDYIRDVLHLDMLHSAASTHR